MLWLPWLIVPGACVVGVEHQRPELDIGDGWINAGTLNEEPPQQWWRQFEDPVLDDLVETAMDQNLGVAAAAARIEAARGVRAAAASGLYPAVDVSSSVTRLRRSENGSLPVNQIPGLDTYQTVYDIGFDAGWEIDLFGRRRRVVEAADARLDSAMEQHRDVIISVIAEVARTYFDLRGAQLELAARSDALAAATRTVELIRAEYDVGAAERAAVSRAEADERLVAATLPALAARRDAAAIALSTLLGELPERRSGLAAQAAPFPELREVPVGTRADLMRRRPDIRISERRLAAATAEIGVARGELYPKLRIGGAAGFEALNGGDLLESTSRRLSLSPILSWRVFDGGRVRAEIHVAEARAREAAIGYESAVLAALADAEQMLIRYRRRLEAVGLQHEAAVATQESRDLIEVRYRAGDVALIELLDAERRVNDARVGLARARSQAAIDLVALYKALGGGWRAGEQFATAAAAGHERG
jgi:NodT family efflux transporter outer membrane factor (OMF) lipoprotein